MMASKSIIAGSKKYNDTKNNVRCWLNKYNDKWYVHFQQAVNDKSEKRKKYIFMMGTSLDKFEAKLTQMIDKPCSESQLETIETHANGDFGVQIGPAKGEGYRMSVVLLDESSEREPLGAIKIGDLKEFIVAVRTLNEYLKQI